MKNLIYFLQEYQKHCHLTMLRRTKIDLVDQQKYEEASKVRQQELEFVETLDKNFNPTSDDIDNFIAKLKSWDWKKYPEEKPVACGRYEVFRAGCKKQHYSTWNGIGWSSDDNTITHFRQIINPE